MKSVEDVLQEPSVRNSLGPLIDELRKHRNLDSDQFRRDLDWEINDESSLAQFMREEVIVKIFSPHQITEQDLIEGVVNFVLLSDQPIELAYSNFVRAMRLATSVHRRSSILPTSTHDAHGFTLRGLSHEQIWESENGFSVRISNVVPAEQNDWRPNSDMHRETICINIVGPCTSAALNQAKKEIQRTITTGLDSIISICGSDYYAVLDAHEFSDNQKPWKTLNANLKPQEMYLLSLLAEMLDCTFNRHGKKDSLAKRIRIAQHLLTESDFQTSKSVSLALAVSSMESLLCAQQSELSQMMADNVAVLLEPRPEYRAEAVSHVKKLYAKRSKVLHGADVDCTFEEHRDARLLAAGVLLAILERRLANRSAGFEDESPQDLLSEMKAAKFSPGQIGWVKESYELTSLWRPKK